MQDPNYTFSNFHQTHSEAMSSVFESIDHVALYDSTVLILGESGVGKEGVVKRIHEKSPRNKGPIVRINCGAIPDNLMESEMFGYAKGAFTGATTGGKLGLIPLANHGTLFLDEVGELSLSIQVKLLRVLQERHFYPIGDVKPVTVDIRIIAATNRNLKGLVEAGKFREDLYYRLNVVPIQIPSLRERKEDIPGLIHFFLQKLRNKYKKNNQLSQEAIELLTQYDWPGNIRELENLVERLVVTIHDDLIDIHHIPEEIRKRTMQNRGLNLKERKTLKEMVSQYEYGIIKDALLRNKTLVRTSAELGIDVSTLSRKCKKYQIHIVD